MGLMVGPSPLTVGEPPLLKLQARDLNNLPANPWTLNTSSIYQPPYSPTPRTLSKFETKVLEKFLMKRKSFENNEFSSFSRQSVDVKFLDISSELQVVHEL